MNVSFQPGDEIVSEVGGIGKLVNKVVWCSDN